MTATSDRTAQADTPDTSRGRIRRIVTSKPAILLGGAAVASLAYRSKTAKRLLSR